MSDLHYRPTAAELVGAVAEFLETEVRDLTGPNGQLADAGAVNFHARVAANVLRTVERELLDTTGEQPRAALRSVNFDDEAQLAAAIRAGEFDGRDADVLPVLRTLVSHRVHVAHPGYDDE